MIKVSLILPSLNVARYMDECLHSVTAQTLKEIEILCIDAGSTDGTVEIIQKYAAQDKRIRLIRSDRKSYGYQMNLGMQHATGTYIGIVETDDYVPSSMYEDLYSAAISHQAEIVKADFYRFRTVGKKIERTYNRLDPSGVYYGQVLNPAEHPQVFRLIMNTWSGIYLRSFLEANQIRHNESPGASYQDNGFWFQTFCCATRVYFVDKPYYMNRRDNEASSVANPGKVYCMTEEWAYIYHWLKQDEKRFRTFIGPYTLRKYHSLLFTSQRIAPEFREEFISHMSREMGALISSGEYDRGIFTMYEWYKLRLIIGNPMGYYQVCASSCCHLTTAKFIARIQKCQCAAALIRKADRLLNKLEMILSWIMYEGPVCTLRRIRWKNVKNWVEKEDAYA